MVDWKLSVERLTAMTETLGHTASIHNAVFDITTSVQILHRINPHFCDSSRSSFGSDTVSRLNEVGNVPRCGHSN